MTDDRTIHQHIDDLVAEDALARWEEFECAGYIRHPAQGGESRFRQGFRELIAARL